jgi:hypothetical protein
MCEECSKPIREHFKLLMFGFDFQENLTTGLIGVNMEKGLDPGTFREIITDFVKRRAAIQNTYEVSGAIEFEYTYWAKPDNKSAVRQNLIDVSFFIICRYSMVFLNLTAASFEFICLRDDSNLIQL